MYRNSKEIKDDIIISIDDVISNNEYNDGRNEGVFSGGRIYVPISKLNQIIDTMLENNHENIEQYPSAQYILYVEDGYDEQVKMKIEEMNDCYYVNNQSLTNQHYVQHFYQQVSHSFVMILLITLLLFMSQLLLIIYYIFLLKDEIRILKRDGLSSFIIKFYRYDDYVFMISWVLISLLMIIGYHYLNPIKNEISLLSYYGLWFVLSVFLYGLILIIKQTIIKKMIKKTND